MAGGPFTLPKLPYAYDALEPRMKAELEGLEAEHYALHSRVMLGDGGGSKSCLRREGKRGRHGAPSTPSRAMTDIGGNRKPSGPREYHSPGQGQIGSPGWREALAAR